MSDKCTKHCAYMMGCADCDATTVEILGRAFVPQGTGNRIHDTTINCPVCRAKGKMAYRVNPNRFVRHTVVDGQARREHFGKSADYQCTVCECEFTLTNIGKKAK